MTSAGAPRTGKSILPQHPQVLRNGRLGDPEFFLHDCADIPGSLLAAFCQQLDEPSADWVVEDV
jgi:hypothetical protein